MAVGVCAKMDSILLRLCSSLFLGPCFLLGSLYQVGSVEFEDKLNSVRSILNSISMSNIPLGKDKLRALHAGLRLKGPELDYYLHSYKRNLPPSSLDSPQGHK